MNGLDWAVLIGYFGVMVAIGVWSHKRVDSVGDFPSFVTGSFPIALGIAIGSKLFAPRINRLRSRLHVTSPLEYLRNRYNLATQQALAWSGMLLKIVDVGAKWARACRASRRGERACRGTRHAGSG